MGALFRTAVSLVAGVLFGVGLAYSGLMNPERVRGFLDVTGDWDPTLAFVLAAAVAVAAIGVIMMKAMSKPLLDDEFYLPADNARVDSQLIAGSAIFGIGWALSGLCPGPAIASIGRDVSTVYVFVLAMIAGILIHAGQAAQSDS